MVTIDSVVDRQVQDYVMHGSLWLIDHARWCLIYTDKTCPGLKMLHSKQANESITFPDQEFGTYRKMVFPLEGKKFSQQKLNDMSL